MWHEDTSLSIKIFSHTSVQGGYTIVGHYCARRGASRHRVGQISGTTCSGWKRAWLVCATSKISIGGDQSIKQPDLSRKSMKIPAKGSLLLGNIYGKVSVNEIPKKRNATVTRARCTFGHKNIAVTQVHQVPCSCANHARFETIIGSGLSGTRWQRNV